MDAEIIQRLNNRSQRPCSRLVSPRLKGRLSTVTEEQIDSKSDLNKAEVFCGWGNVGLKLNFVLGQVRRIYALPRY